MSELERGSEVPLAADPQAEHRVRVAAAQGRILRGAGWFDWIAAVSVLNSFIALFNSTLPFLVGLGITQLVNYEAQQNGSSHGKVIAFMVTLLPAAFFWVMGRFAKQGARWALIVGMFLYLLDGIFLLTWRQWLPVAFHAYVLFMLTKTIAAIQQFEAAKQG